MTAPLSNNLRERVFDAIEAGDLNPIEQAFAKIKHWMRQAQKRTVEDTWRHIGHLVSTIEPDECANYLTNAGYPSAKT